MVHYDVWAFGLEREPWVLIGMGTWEEWLQQLLLVLNELPIGGWIYG